MVELALRVEGEDDGDADLVGGLLFAEEVPQRGVRAVDQGEEPVDLFPDTAPGESDTASGCSSTVSTTVSTASWGVVAAGMTTRSGWAGMRISWRRLILSVVSPL